MAIDFPNSPTIGDTYTTNGKTYRWDGTVWGIYGTFSRDFTASDTEPTGVSDGHIWYRSDQSQTLIRYDGTWVEVGSAGGFDSSSTSFPSSLDSGTGFAAVEALQAKVGVDGSAVTTSIDYQLNTGYRYHSTVYFTSSGTFTKATYPWLRAIRVKVQGAGGGGGSGARTTGSFGNNHGAAGAAGGYAERFITDIAGLAASETVTVGSGGAGGANPDTSDVYNVGSNGGNSSAFGLTGTGGQGGNNAVITNCCDFVAYGGQPSGTYDFGVDGEGGNYRRQNLSREQLNGAKDYVYGGVSYLSMPSRSVSNNGGASLSTGYGFGGNPGKRTANTVGTGGQVGGDGVVIVELFA